MPSKQQVQEALRRSGGDYAAAGAALGIPPGRAHLIATGVPADVNPAQHDPQPKAQIVSWIRERAARDLTAPR